MSGIKTILVPVSDHPSSALALRTALELAGTLSARVEALHVRPDPASAVPLVGEGLSGAMVEDMIGAAETRAAEAAAAARALYDAAVPPGADSGWNEQTGLEDEILVWQARLHDLLVMARPDENEDSQALLSINAALMDGGRPLLVVPPHPPEQIGRAVAIAWNGSREAARAVTAALPLLESARSVTVLAVSEDDETGRANGAELTAYLARHGIAATSHHIHASGHHAGQLLLAAVTDCGADLLVMGAYTHSRLRQLILGGVTRQVLHHAAVPVLMCH